MSQPVLSLRTAMEDLVSFRCFVMLWGGLLLTILVRDSGPVLSVVAFASAAAMLSLRIPVYGALGVGGVAWLVANGFVVNEYGTLAWTGYSDALRLGVLLTAALCAAEMTGPLR